MGYSKPSEPVRVALPSNPSYWVEVNSDLKWGQMKKFVSVAEDGKVNMVAASDAFMQAMIRSWNLDDDQGNVLPITLDNIDLLEREDALAIINAAGAEAEDPKKKLSSTSPSEASSPAQN